MSFKEKENARREFKRPIKLAEGDTEVKLHSAEELNMLVAVAQLEKSGELPVKKKKNNETLEIVEE